MLQIIGSCCHRGLVSTSNENNPIEQGAGGRLGAPLGLAVLLFPLISSEIGLHAVMASQTAVGHWLLRIYTYRFMPSGRGWSYILDWLVPCAILGLPTGVWGYRWSCSRMACVCLSMAWAVVLIVWIDYHILPAWAVWWVPKAPDSQLCYYLLWVLFPATLLIFLFGFGGRRFERDRPQDSSWPRGSLRRRRRV